MLMELIPTYSGPHYADSSNCFHRELFMPTLPNLLLDSECFFDMHPNTNEAGLPGSHDNHPIQLRQDGFDYEDDNEHTSSNPQSVTGTLAGSHWPVQGIQSHSSSNDDALGISYDSPFKPFSTESISHSSYSAHLTHYYNALVVPDISHSVTYLPLNDVASLTSTFASPIHGSQHHFAPLMAHPDHGAVKKETYDEPVHLRYPGNLPSLPQSTPNAGPVELSTSYPGSTLGDVQRYPDMTTMVNSNAAIAAPMVETTFVDLKVCNVCGKRITRDMIRHMRTHQAHKRFNCMFPKDSCDHKSGQFNRRYDFKKHLLNKHFDFVNPSVKKVHNLRDKLNDWGYCPCGRQFLSSDWLENHILTDDETKKCPMMTEKTNR